MYEKLVCYFVSTASSIVDSKTNRLACAKVVMVSYKSAKQSLFHVFLFQVLKRPFAFECVDARSSLRVRASSFSFVLKSKA